MSTPDWSKAPEVATHWDGVLFRDKYGAWGMDGRYRNDVFPQFDPGWIPRPVQWRGPQDGLPPVGAVCEYKIGNGNWFECEIISHSRLVIKCPHLENDCDQGLQIVGDKEAVFRPIQSDRDRAIEEMLSLDASDGRLTSRTDFCGALYDAGYRKT